MNSYYAVLSVGCRQQLGLVINCLLLDGGDFSIRLRLERSGLRKQLGSLRTQPGLYEFYEISKQRHNARPCIDDRV